MKRWSLQSRSPRGGEEEVEVDRRRVRREGGREVTKWRRRCRRRSAGHLGRKGRVHRDRGEAEGEHRTDSGEWRVWRGPNV